MFCCYLQVFLCISYGLIIALAGLSEECTERHSLLVQATYGSLLL